MNCPKCGCATVTTRHHSDNFTPGRYTCWSCPGPNREHLHYYCGCCTYQWWGPVLAEPEDAEVEMATTAWVRQMLADLRRELEMRREFAKPHPRLDTE